MSNDKENEIRFRLKILSQIEPSQESTQSAVEKIRETLTKSQKQPVSDGTGIIRKIFNGQILKFAIAALLLIGIGFIAGQLVRPTQPEINMEEIKLLVETECAKTAENTLAASATLMDRQRNEIIGLVEAARQSDRQWIAAAFDKIESDRRVETNRLGNSLIALAARTNERSLYKQN